MNNKCPCFRYHRECTDKCERCRKKQVSKKGCRNTRIQNNDGEYLKEKKNYKTKIQILSGPRIVVAESNISGWGAFLFENVKKNDFICEYVGEIITQSEVSRRSVVSNARGASYFFDLNPDQTIDASRRGNQARFVNHSNQPNCVIKKIMSNGTPKIVIIAKEKMVKGTELFINYMENFPTQGFCTSTEHGSVPVKELHEKFIHHGWLHYDPGNEIQEPDVVAPESSPT